MARSDPTDFASNLAIGQQGAQDVATNSLNAQKYAANEMEMQQARAAQQQQQQFSADLQAAGGDPAKMQDLALKYPSQAKQIGEALGIKDQQHAADINNAVGDLNLASKIGTDQAMAGAISKHRDLITSLGSTPQELFQTWKQNPQQFGNIVNAAGMATVPFAKQQELNAQNYRTDATMRGQNLAYDTAAANRQVTREGQQITREGQQVTRETNQLTQQKTRQEMANQRSEQGKTAQAAVDAWTTQNDLLNRNMLSVNNAVGQLNDDGTINTKTPEYANFQKGFGAAGWVQKNIPGSDAANTWGKIKGMQADARQMGIAGLKGLGSASDADAAAAQNAFLNIDDKTDAATAKQATEKYISVLRKYQQNNNSPTKLKAIMKAKTTAWAANNSVNPDDAATFMREAANGNAEQARQEWAQVYPNVAPPSLEDFQ